MSDSLYHLNPWAFAESLDIVDQFQELGFDSSYLDSVNNAVGIRGRSEAKITIMLLGHIDTVPGHIPVRIENGELYGRGSVDAKGSLATFALAAAQVTLPPDIRLVVAGAVEEESATSKGARQIARDFTADYCHNMCILLGNQHASLGNQDHSY